VISVCCQNFAGWSWIIIGGIVSRLDDLVFEFRQGQEIVLSCTTRPAVVPTVSSVEWVQYKGFL
jgi:hypothetical protein